MAEEGAGAPEGARRPVCLAIILCDAVIEDKTTNNKTLVGLFNTIAAARYPTVRPAMSVFASLTGCRSEMRLELRIRREGAEGEIVRFGGPLVSPSEAAIVDLVVHLRNMKLPAPGVYRVEILHDGQPLAARHFRAVRVSPSQARGGVPPERPSGAPPGEPPASWRAEPSEN